MHEMIFITFILLLHSIHMVEEDSTSWLRVSQSVSNAMHPFSIPSLPTTLPFVSCYWQIGNIGSLVTPYSETIILACCVYLYAHLTDTYTHAHTDGDENMRQSFLPSAGAYSSVFLLLHSLQVYQFSAQLSMKNPKKGRIIAAVEIPQQTSPSYSPFAFFLFQVLLSNRIISKSQACCSGRRMMTGF